MKIISLLIGFIACCQIISAQAPKFSNDFLNIGIGSKGMALGSAVSSNSNDIYAAYWNPAGLSHVESNFQVGAQHAQWFGGIGNYDYIGFGKKLDPAGKSFGAVSIIRLGIDDIPNTLLLRAPDGSIDYSRLKTFSVADYAFILSYARKYKETNWSYGLNAKIIHRTFGSFANAWGFGFDAGILYQKEKWGFAIMGRDITTTFNAYKYKFSDDEKAVLLLTGNDVPNSSVEYTLPKLVLGTSYLINFNSKFKFRPALDIEFSGNSTKSGLISSKNFIADPRIGFEFSYIQKIFLRLGAQNFQFEKSDTQNGKDEFIFQPNGGLGIRFGKIGLDYALTNIGTVGAGLYSHYFSVVLNF
ncbi:MAG: PorV/PorQ family protein [Saprospiraceae bacterium]|nr:PorV/PorQ family protein [Saprospiraceae bacterium]